MVFKYKSEEKVVLLLFVSGGLSQLDLYTLNSIVGLDLLSKAILELFANCQATYTMEIITITQSKKWWNNKLKTILETYR